MSRDPDSASLALIRRLCAEGILGAADIDAIAADLDERGEVDAAHAVRCEMLRACEPEAEPPRSRLKIVPDGGNA